MKIVFFISLMMRLNPSVKFNLIERHVRKYPVFTLKLKIKKFLKFFSELVLIVEVVL